nr:immunoglobulin heavy chain junction region [Mus musculus]
CAKTGTDFDYW